MVNDNGRFGSRYGRKIRKRVFNVEQGYRGGKKHCPYCEKDAVKRLSAGIYQCKNCNKKFAGASYKPESLAKRILNKLFDKNGKFILKTENKIAINEEKQEIENTN